MNYTMQLAGGAVPNSWHWDGMLLVESFSDLNLNFQINGRLSVSGLNFGVIWNVNNPKIVYTLYYRMLGQPTC